MPRPGRLHRKAHKGIVDVLRGWDVDRRGKGWWSEVEPELRLGYGDWSRQRGYQGGDDAWERLHQDVEEAWEETHSRAR